LAKQNRNVIRYRRPLKLNIGLIIFIILFFYLIFSVYSYMRRPKIRFYEVEAGGMVNDTGHTGLILRTEDVQTAPVPGYINYYIREGKRAAVGTRICSLDETGSLRKYLEENSSNTDSLSEQNLRELKTRLSSFAVSYEPDNFRVVYDSRDAIQSALSEYTSMNVLFSLDQTLRDNGITFTQVTSPESGVVSFNVDNFEGLTADQVTAEHFSSGSYHPSWLTAGELADSGMPIYKIIPSEDWQVVFPLTEEEDSRYADRKSLRIQIKGYDTPLTGDFQELTGADGGRYGVLTFHQFMVRFVSDRYLDFQIVSGNDSGLKIPRSAITEKLFFTIPKEYLTNGGNSVDAGFITERYAQDGTSEAVFVPAEIFYESADSCYIDASGKGPLNAGDYIIRPGSEERYQIGATANLQGVYNINKGYAVFKQIEIIEENDEYVTIRRGTSYGLNVFDHILLNGAEGSEGETIYQR